ncbi:MAG TPA: ATP-dependent DNA helicase [Puia sp.]|nr:ATP-dependent DNA helicase [Puia sp.]
MDQNEVFRNLYQRLNAQQRRAVDTLDGPVMVIAGPGTGKTQILSARIGKILTETDTEPGNILCLTYTDAGAVAMRRRLISFIGPDAYKVNIYTFHAFCNDIIQDNLAHFEKSSLDPVSELEQIEFLKQLIDSFPKNHPLKRFRSDAYYEVGNLRSLFSTMKREGWTPAFINERIDEYLARIQDDEKYVYKKSGPGYKKGDKKQHELDEQRTRMEKLRAAANEFDRFQQIMRHKNRYDFDDMINWVIRAFSENEQLLRRYQEKYQYILVDEYQDTSGTQNRLVEILINFWEKPNIFVVGDDDQSIYRFQGANMDNLINFSNHYARDLLTVVLTNNYRSTQPILDLSKALISRNSERLVNKIEGLSKELLASREGIPAAVSLPVIREYDTERSEMIDIVMQVEQLIKAGVEPGRIGIIYKENRYGEELLRLFKLKQVPVYSRRSVNLLNDPLVQQILLILNYLCTEHDIPFSGDEMLFEILHAEWFRIPPIEIANLTTEVAKLQYTAQETSLRKWLYDKSNRPARDLFSQPVHPQLAAASQVIETLIGRVSNTTLQSLVECIFRETGMLNEVMVSPRKLEMLQVITAFFDFVKEETRRRPSLNLKELVTHLELMVQEDLSIPLIEVSGRTDSVNLMTAHGSKGLEFEYVFFAGAVAHYWEKKRKPGGGFQFPDTLFVSHDADADQEELRRLFYVALTRAEMHLYISYFRFRDDGKDAEPSVFIEEIRSGFELETEKPVLSPEAIAAFQLWLLQGERPPEIEHMEYDFVQRLLENFQMNVTALNNYLKCPLEFYYRNLLRIPSPKNENTEFGSAVHYALEQLFRNMQENGNRFPELSFFLDAFDWYMHRHRESFTPEQFARRMDYGHIMLPDYYNKYLPTWNRIVSIERSVRNVAVQGVPLKGKIDKLEFDGKLVNLVDYKTGNPENGKKKLVRPSEKEPNGGDYWRQAVFYKMLIDQQGQRDWQVVSAEFDFVEPDSKKNFHKVRLQIMPEDTVTVTQQIRSVWDKIQQHDFYTGCGKEDCHWCRFVKTNRLDVALEEEEMTDDR